MCLVVGNWTYFSSFFRTEEALFNEKWNVFERLKLVQEAYSYNQLKNNITDKTVRSREHSGT